MWAPAPQTHTHKPLEKRNGRRKRKVKKYRKRKQNMYTWKTWAKRQRLNWLFLFFPLFPRSLSFFLPFFLSKIEINVRVQVLSLSVCIRVFRECPCVYSMKFLWKARKEYTIYASCGIQWHVAKQKIATAANDERKREKLKHFMDIGHWKQQQNYLTAHRRLCRFKSD